MPTRILTVSLIVIYGFIAVGQPVFHEIFCPIDGVLITWCKQRQFESSELQSHDSGQRLHHPGTPVLDCSIEFLAQHEVEEHCDGDCIASLVQDSEGWLASCNAGSNSLILIDSHLCFGCDRFPSLDRVRSRGPPTA